MNKNATAKRDRSEHDENSLGILSMENLKVFGDLSSLCRSESVNRESSSVNERLKAERMRALQTLEKSRTHRSSATSSRETMGRNSTQLPSNRASGFGGVNSINISELMTDETIDLNSTGSFALPSAKATNISFEPAEITGRSTLCQSDGRSARQSSTGSSKPSSRKAISVADILKTSFVEKARMLEKKLEQASTASSSFIESSFSCSRSLPRTADMSQHSNLTLNGGSGFSFGSGANQEFDESNFSAAAGFAPAELMQSKLVLGEISWAQEFTAMPTATLSKQAMEMIAAPAPASDIETSVSNSVIAGDPDFSVGNFFETRSENIWNIVNTESPDKMRPPEALVNPNASLSSIVSAGADKTPKPDNKTYTKAESIANLERNMLKKKQQERINSALQTKKAADNQRSPTSEFLSLSAIDRALRDLNLSSDTSSMDVVNKLWGHGYKPHNDAYDEEDKENSLPTLTDSRKPSDTMSFTDSILNSTDIIQLQQSIAVPRHPLSPLADCASQPQIMITHIGNSGIDEAHDADIDDWPSTPVKSPGRRVRRTKSPNSVSPAPSDGVQPLPTSDDDEVDEDKTPVNKKRSIALSCNPTSLSSTRLDGCDAVPSSTECEFGISPSLGRSTSTTNATLTSRNASPLSSPRSCLSSPLLDSTTNSDRRQLMPGAARKTHSSPAGSEASSTSGFAAVRRAQSSGNHAARSMSRCSNSSEFSHRDGKILPLKVTHTSLCWGSTKLRTDVRKSMQVKNTANKRLAVRLGIQGPGFQLVSGDSNTITLQAMECRTVSINFCPTVCGAAIGSLAFYAPLGAHNANMPLMEIPLYGYGGNASLTIQGLLKGPVGSSFLTIGDVCELSSGPLTATFKFYNKGPLTAYAGISVDSTVLMKPRLSEAFEVRPSKVIIPPHSEALVQIIFRPNREDMKNIMKKLAQVMTLANMRIFCGDEPNRQRMRALVQRMTSKQREQLTSSMLDSIWCSFPDEQPIRSIATLNEPPEFILDLVTVVRIIDVALTLNRDFDESAETSLLFMPEADETVLFRTICAANSPTPTQSNMLEPVDELLEADTTSVGSDQRETVEQNWSVQPTSIELDLSGVGRANRAVLYVKNCFKSGQYIEINSNVADLFQITPSESYVAPDGGQVEITVRALRIPRREMLKENILIMVSMENERISVPVIFNV